LVLMEDNRGPPLLSYVNCVVGKQDRRSRW
jgi:hypothetical protein